MTWDRPAGCRRTIAGRRGWRWLASGEAGGLRRRRRGRARCAPWVAACGVGRQRAVEAGRERLATCLRPRCPAVARSRQARRPGRQPRPSPPHPLASSSRGWRPIQPPRQGPIRARAPSARCGRRERRSHGRARRTRNSWCSSPVGRTAGVEAQALLARFNERVGRPSRGASLRCGGCSVCPRGHLVPPMPFEPVDLRKHSSGTVLIMRRPATISGDSTADQGRDLRKQLDH
jgi:hypothetical protein